MSRFIEQEICRISYTVRKKKLKFSDWHMKIGSLTWMTAVFFFRNIPVDDPQKTIKFIKKNQLQ